MTDIPIDDPDLAAEWALMETELDCLTRRAKARFVDQGEDGRSGWETEEARFHLFKAHDQMSVASYHARQDDDIERDELVLTNLADALNHILMAMSTTDVDLDRCQPLMADDLGDADG